MTVLARKLNLPSLEPSPWKAWLSRASSELADVQDFLQQEFERLSGGGLVLDTKQARKVSYTMRTCDGVGLDLLDEYLGSWRDSGFLR